MTEAKLEASLLTVARLSMTRRVKGLVLMVVEVPINSAGSDSMEWTCQYVQDINTRDRHLEVTQKQHVSDQSVHV